MRSCHVLLHQYSYTDRALQTATETVRYGLSWAIATVGCSNNFDASLSANCGTSGVIALEQTTDLGNTVISCSVVDSNTIDCAGRNGLRTPDFEGLVLNSGLIFSCTGSTARDVRATAVATISSATCTSSSSGISHGTGLLVENNDNGNVRITSSCASGVEIEDTICVDLVECSAPFGGTCTTRADTVTTTQDLPIPGFGNSGAMSLGMVGTFGVGFMSVLAMMVFGMTTAFFG